MFKGVLSDQITVSASVGLSTAAIKGDTFGPIKASKWKYHPAEE
jgi:hypothetical protein